MLSKQTLVCQICNEPVRNPHLAKCMHIVHEECLATSLPCLACKATQVEIQTAPARAPVVPTFVTLELPKCLVCMKPIDYYFVGTCQHIMHRECAAGNGICKACEPSIENKFFATLIRVLGASNGMGQLLTNNYYEAIMHALCPGLQFLHEISLGMFVAKTLKHMKYETVSRQLINEFIFVYTCTLYYPPAFAVISAWIVGWYYVDTGLVEERVTNTRRYLRGAIQYTVVLAFAVMVLLPKPFPFNDIVADILDAPEQRTETITRTLAFVITSVPSFFAQEIADALDVAWVRNAVKEFLTITAMAISVPALHYNDQVGVLLVSGLVWYHIWSWPNIWHFHCGNCFGLLSIMMFVLVCLCVTMFIQQTFANYVCVQVYVLSRVFFKQRDMKKYFTGLHSKVVVMGASQMVIAMMMMKVSYLTLVLKDVLDSQIYDGQES